MAERDIECEEREFMQRVSVTKRGERIWERKRDYQKHCSCVNKFSWLECRSASNIKCLNL